MGKLQKIIGITGSLILAMISIFWLVALVLAIINEVSLNALEIKYIIVRLERLLVLGSSIAINIYQLKLSANNSERFKLVGLIRITAAVLGFVCSFYFYWLAFPMVLALIISGIVLLLRPPAKSNSRQVA